MKIEKYLVLNKYLLSLFGVAEVRDLQKELAETPVGDDSDGRSYFVNVLRSLDGLQRSKLSEETLLHYVLLGTLMKIDTFHMGCSAAPVSRLFTCHGVGPRQVLEFLGVIREKRSSF